VIPVESSIATGTDWRTLNEAYVEPIAERYFYAT